MESIADLGNQSSMGGGEWFGALRIVSAGLLQRISANWNCSGQGDGFREELAASYENCKRSHNGKFYSFKQAFS
jgi:hypothetical protein